MGFSKTKRCPFESLSGGNLRLMVTDRVERCKSMSASLLEFIQYADLQVQLLEQPFEDNIGEDHLLSTYFGTVHSCVSAQSTAACVLRQEFQALNEKYINEYNKLADNVEGLETESKALWQEVEDKRKYCHEIRQAIEQAASPQPSSKKKASKKNYHHTIKKLQSDYQLPQKHAHAVREYRVALAAYNDFTAQCRAAAPEIEHRIITAHEEFVAMVNNCVRQAAKLIHQAYVNIPEKLLEPDDAQEHAKRSSLHRSASGATLTNNEHENVNNTSSSPSKLTVAELGPSSSPQSGKEPSANVKKGNAGGSSTDAVVEKGEEELSEEEDSEEETLDFTKDDTAFLRLGWQELFPLVGEDMAAIQEPNWEDGGRTPTRVERWVAPNSSTLEGLSQDDLRVQRVIQELIQTEEDYVESLLMIESVFRRPMMELKVITPEEHECIFATFVAILNVNQTFLQRLHDECCTSSGLTHSASGSERDPTPSPSPAALSSPISVAKVGSVFKTMASFFKVYASYAQRDEVKVKKITQEKQKVHEFVEEAAAEASELLRGLDFKSMMIKPIQRVMKYPLLLRDIIKHTSDNQEGYGDLLKALQEVEVVCLFINEERRSSEAWVEMIRVNKLLERGSGRGLPLLSKPSRRLLLDTTVTLIDKKLPEGSDPVRRLILFSDLLLLAKAVKSKKGRMSRKKEGLELTTVVPLQAIFTLKMDGDVLKIPTSVLPTSLRVRFPSAGECEVWAGLLGRVLGSIGGGLIPTPSPSPSHPSTADEADTPSDSLVSSSHRSVGKTINLDPDLQRDPFTILHEWGVTDQMNSLQRKTLQPSISKEKDEKEKEKSEKKEKEKEEKKEKEKEEKKEKEKEEKKEKEKEEKKEKEKEEKKEKKTSRSTSLLLSFPARNRNRLTLQRDSPSPSSSNATPAGSSPPSQQSTSPVTSSYRLSGSGAEEMSNEAAMPGHTMVMDELENKMAQGVTALLTAPRPASPSSAKESSGGLTSTRLKHVSADSKESIRSRTKTVGIASELSAVLSARHVARTLKQRLTSRTIDAELSAQKSEHNANRGEAEAEDASFQGMDSELAAKMRMRKTRSITEVHADYARVMGKDRLSRENKHTHSDMVLPTALGSPSPSPSPLSSTASSK